MAMATMKPNQLVGIRILIVLLLITLTTITLEVSKLSEITIQISLASSSANSTILTNHTNDSNNNSEMNNHDHLIIPNIPATTRRRCHNNNGNTHNNNGLTAIVHIGPPKTGTTSIQSWTKVLLQQLTDDGYQLPWHLRLMKEEQQKTSNSSYSIPNLKRATSISRLHSPHNMVQVASCFMNTNRTPSRYCQPVIFDEIINISKNGKHLLLTAELFATFRLNEVEKLYQTLSKYYQNIIIVMYYRRYSDWSVSQYYEWNKRKVNSRESFLSHLSNDHTEVWNLIKDNYMKTITDDYNNCYFNSNITMKVYNFHNLSQYNNDLLLSFYCDAIPNATNTCNKLKELSTQLRQLEQQQQDNNDNENTEETDYLTKIQSFQNANQAIPFVYNDIVYAAYQMNMIPTIDNRNTKKQKGVVNKIVRMVHHYQVNVLNLTQYDFINESIVCINNKVITRILHDTVQIEKNFFPYSFNSMNIITNFHETTSSLTQSKSSSNNETYDNDIFHQVRKHFEQKKKALFCTINASIVVQLDKRWQQFFQSIEI